MNVTRISCPQCQTPLEDAESKVSLLSGAIPEDHYCPKCGYHYQVRCGILDFSPEDHFYWGEISQQEMIDINQQADQKGWFQALSADIDKISNRDLTHYLFDRVRVAGLFHYYNPERKEAVLDLGSGWGPIAFGLSKFYETVYSMDGVYERLRFQAIRASQDDVGNIRILKGTLLRLPFEADSMDTVIVNGLLEWIGLSDRVTNPQQLQKQFLAEVYRVLKPGGKLYIGIENRFGVQYLLGGRDHSGLRFTSLMPRWMANWVMKLFERKVAEGGEDFSFSGTGASYRTLTYSGSGYRKLLQQTGFIEPRMYWARADYNYPWISGTMDGDSLKFYLNNFDHQSRGIGRILKWIAAHLPKKVLGLFVRTFSTDFLIVASKEVAIAGLEEKLLPAQKQTSFLRTTLDTRAGLQTAYWLMDGHGLGKIVQLQPINQDGQKTFEIQDVAVEPAGSHPLWPDSLPEVRLAAQWLADLQAKNQSGFWPTEQLQAELDDIVEKITLYTEDSDLLAQLDAYKGQYLEGLTNLTMPVVVEHGDFTPSNIIVTKDQTIQVIHWENSKQVGHPMMDIGGLYLSLLLKDPHSEDSLAAIHESYHLPFEIPLRLSPAYFVLRSINREMRDSSLNAKNYVSWKYWVQPLRLALQHTNLVKVH